MGHLIFPQPVKFILAILYGKIEHLDKALARIRENWGEIDFQGQENLFDITSYYETEMGYPLYRRLISLASLILPDELIQLKIQSNQLEESLSLNSNRTVNLDVGYLDDNKIVLASVKPAGQKIYLGGGIYADLLARFKSGFYQPFEWTFPDFKDERYKQELLTIRSVYLQQLRPLRINH